jgi:hypothetical protein|tara:strand:+ start:202 stop:879 length:678 start_codon:yes stop_codon:yes gene_type:complete
MATKTAKKTSNKKTKAADTVNKPATGKVTIAFLVALLTANVAKAQGLTKDNQANGKVIQSLKRTRVSIHIQMRNMQTIGLKAFNSKMRNFEDTANGGSISDDTFKKLSRYVNDKKVQKAFDKMPAENIIKAWDSKKLTSWNKVFDARFDRKSQSQEKLNCLSDASIEIYNACVDNFNDTHGLTDKELSDDDQKQVDGWSNTVINYLYNYDRLSSTLTNKFNEQGS